MKHAAPEGTPGMPPAEMPLLAQEAVTPMLQEPSPRHARENAPKHAASTSAEELATDAWPPVAEAPVELVIRQAGVAPENNVSNDTDDKQSGVAIGAVRVNSGESMPSLAPADGSEAIPAATSNDPIEVAPSIFLPQPTKGLGAEAVPGDEIDGDRPKDPLEPSYEGMLPLEEAFARAKWEEDVTKAKLARQEFDIRTAWRLLDMKKGMLTPSTLASLFSLDRAIAVSPDGKVARYTQPDGTVVDMAQVGFAQSIKENVRIILDAATRGETMVKLTNGKRLSITPSNVNGALSAVVAERPEATPIVNTPKSERLLRARSIAGKVGGALVKASQPLLEGAITGAQAALDREGGATPSANTTPRPSAQPRPSLLRGVVEVLGGPSREDRRKTVSRVAATAVAALMTRKSR